MEGQAVMYRNGLASIDSHEHGYDAEPAYCCMEPNDKYSCEENAQTYSQKGIILITNTYI